MNWTSFLAAHEFFAPRRSVFQNREAIVLSFRPRPDLGPGDGTIRVLARLGGRIWIDAADRIIMRLEAVPLQVENGATSMTSPPAATIPDHHAPVAFEWTRLPNGTWLQSLFHLNTYGRKSLFEGISVSRTSRFRDFKLFDTSVGQERLDPPRP